MVLEVSADMAWTPVSPASINQLISQSVNGIISFSNSYEVISTKNSGRKANNTVAHTLIISTFGLQASPYKMAKQ